MAELENPKHEIFAVESTAGLSQELAYMLAELDAIPEAERDRPSRQRHSHIARKAMGTIKARIGHLAAFQSATEDEAEFREHYLRTVRAIAELRWCVAVVGNGGWVGLGDGGRGWECHVEYQIS